MTDLRLKIKQLEENLKAKDQMIRHLQNNAETSKFSAKIYKKTKKHLRFIQVSPLNFSKFFFKILLHILSECGIGVVQKWGKKFTKNLGH